jgi:PTS system mannose-specific IIB component/fructoselysine and glucoselysine-specific PTS system IIB component
VSWLLHRVDDRLVHGQVVIAWGQRLRPKRIWVVDDAVAATPWERQVLEDAVPDLEVRVLRVDEAAQAYAAEREAPGGAFLLVRDLATALRLVEAGAPVPRFNLGGLHYAPGKQKVNEYVYLDADDRAAARSLLGRGVELEVQDVPASRAQSLATLDPLSVRA